MNAPVPERRITMKRITSIFLTLALLISFVLPMTAFAAGNGWYEVCSTSPNGYCYLYSAASDRDGLSVNRGRYNNGTIVYVLDYYGGQDGKYNYCYVQTQDGKTGYMHDYALRAYNNNYTWYVVNSSQPKGYCYLYTAASDRDGISTNMGRYNNGSLVRLLEYYGGQDGKYNYCLVQTMDGKTGYMHDYAIRPFKPGEVIVTPKPTAKPTARPTAKPTATPRPTARPVGLLAQLPELTPQGYGNVRGGNTPVYTGPSDDYYRTTSGKAYVANGGSLRLYGKENGHYLVQYAANLNGKSVSRWSFIPTARFSVNNYWVETLTYDWLPITIKNNAHMSDAPTWTHSYDDQPIEIERDTAYALAKYIDDEGTYWVYFEALGYADTVANHGYVSVRGFVPMDQVSLRK